MTFVMLWINADLRLLMKGVALLCSSLGCSKVIAVSDCLWYHPAYTKEL